MKKSMFLGESIIKTIETGEKKIVHSENLENSIFLINHDLGLWDPIKSDYQREYLISVVSHESKLAIFSSDGKITLMQIGMMSTNF